MKKNLLNQPLFRLLVPSVYGIMMYFLILLINNSLGQLSETVLTNELLLCIVLAYMVAESVRLLIVIFERRVQENLRKTVNIIYLFVGSLVIGSVVTYLIVYGYYREIEEAEYFSTFSSILYKITTIYGINAMFYTLFFLSIHLLSIKNESELKKEDLKRQNLEHQLEIFNNEINPDLLFQSLETLISLVHHNLNSAEDFVDRLALVYRYILDNRKKEVVALEDELRAAKNLVYLFKEKFPDQVTLTIKNEVQTSSKYLVPNTIPMVLDCMINGSIISPWQPMNIIIDCAGEDDYVVVQHKGNDKLSNNKYIKNRFQNLHETFAFFTDKPVIQIKAYGDVFIKMPILEINDNL
ncbi:histidine kinase [Roseivirga misakiensis]|uniref:Signal transduction histidine kinase internal region domain-containing protein n=1 Tax=Roseivirga misakiensis TaxID=1563681 RepID=A0A1E5T6Z7_9BACT|nr:sensor histidine kinase [Roseivirga misakiensis]OEK07143.1 hypothetical protein BFP71_05660 [Roseivirga misakiensis]